MGKRAEIEINTIIGFILLIVGIVLLALLINGLSGNLESVGEVIENAIEDFA